jgi:hypothetical protein
MKNMQSSDPLFFNKILAVDFPFETAASFFSIISSTYNDTHK